jgi:prephenate dehydrogenase
MAGTPRVVGRLWNQTGDDAIRALVEEHNKLVADVEALRAHVVAETAATIAASALTAATVTTREAGNP